MPKLIKITKWLNPLKNMKKEDVDIPDDAEGGDEEFLENGEDSVTQTGTKVLGTPFGLVPIDNQWLIDNHIEFWMIETNFNINQPIIEAIKNIEGIEILHVFTRYKARFGVPRSGLFKSDKVIEQVKKKISEVLRIQQLAPIADLSAELQTKVAAFRDKVHKKYKYWVLLILPNGNIEIATSKKNDDEFLEKIKGLKAACQISQGRIIISD